mgnify:CR=1 FL=1
MNTFFKLISVPLALYVCYNILFNFNQFFLISLGLLCLAGLLSLLLHFLNHLDATAQQNEPEDFQ